ncbi:MAG TPA: IS200/IS605 family transposase [Blastocatellia bacterium]|nr:IS200/IS605 family transposase [Blastocatellia bacterium]
MSAHSYSRCWLHLTWSTLNRARLLPKPAAAKLSVFLSGYAQSKDIYMRINYVNAEHVHTLIDLPTRYSIEDVVKLLKGASSHWVNQNRIVPAKFAWGRGYGAFSVSQSNVNDVSKYIANQEEHHRAKTFAEEYRSFVRAYGLEWSDEVTGKNR